MDKTNSLQRSSESTADKITLSKCIESKPLAISVKTDLSNIITRIGIEIDRLVIVFNWKPVPGWKLSFIDMIIDRYKVESLEDVLMCLRDGRLGKYKKPYGVLDPITFSEWMSEHLDRKYMIIEKEKQKLKPEAADNPKFKTRQEYNDFVKIGLLNQGESIRTKKSKMDDDDNYRKFRAEYISKRKPKEK